MPLGRYYDMHKCFPETLEAVCDHSMPRIPVEWFLGYALVFKQRRNRFILDVPDAAERRSGARLKNHDEKAGVFGVDFNVRKPEAQDHTE